MHRNIFFLAGSLCLLALAPCTEPITFTGYETDPIPVMQATAEQDSLFHARLTWSRFFLQDEGAFRTINNANVQLLVNGTTKTLMKSDSGNYIFSYFPQPGDSIHITAQIPGYERGNLSAQTVVPFLPQAELGSWVVDSSQNTNYNKNYAVTIKLRLNDPGNEENYYALRLLYSNKTTPNNHSNPVFTKEFSINDPLITGSTSSIDIIRNEGESDQYYRKLYFSDQNINGKSHNITIQTKFYAYSISDDSTGSDSTAVQWQHIPDVLCLEVYSLSPEEFRYLQSSEAARSNDNNFFSEPVQVICNVENGIGHLGAISRKKINMQFN